MRNPQTNRVNAIVIFLGSILFNGIALGMWGTIVQLSISGVSTEAIIVGGSTHYENGRRQRNPTYSLTYQITIDDNKLIEKTEKVSQQYYFDHHYKDIILVRYVKYNPAVSRIYGNEDMGGAIFFSLVGVFSFLLSGYIFFAIKRAHVRY